MAIEMAKIEVEWRPAPQARVRIAPTYQDQRITGQYVPVVRDPLATTTHGSRYIFANVRRHELSVDTRLDWTLSPWLSLQLFLQRFAASGRFSRFREFTTSCRLAFAEYGVDATPRRGVQRCAIQRQRTGAAHLRRSGTSRLSGQVQPLDWSLKRTTELGAVTVEQPAPCSPACGTHRYVMNSLSHPRADSRPRTRSCSRRADRPRSA